MIQVSAAHKVVGVPVSPALANLFPNAPRTRFQGRDTIILPHGPYETLVLRGMGFDIPAPIMAHYDWAGGKPFEVQKKTAAMLTTHQRAYVLNGMGTGKTRTALWAFDYLRSVGLVKRALIVAPLSTLNFTWAHEAFRTVPHLKVAVLHGSRQKRIDRLNSDADILIINPEGLVTLVDNIVGPRNDLKPTFDLMVLDELALFRNGSSLRHKMTKKIAAKVPWVWGMTGSPTPNEPTDVWGQAQIVTPERVSRSFNRFRDELMVKVSNFQFHPKKDAAERAFATLQPAVRFTLDDVVELPDVVERVVDVEMGEKQAKVYKALADHAYAMVQSSEITAVNAGAVLNKLLQVSIGYVYAKDREVVALDNVKRLDALIDCINASDNKVLVFVPYTHALDGVAARLTQEGIDHRTVHGGVSRKEREDTFRLFQNTGAVKVIVAHPATMSHGLTLTAADTIIWFSPTTSLETFEQANARIRRVGQTKKQQILMFQGTPAEKRIYARLRKKQKVQDRILSLFSDKGETE